MEKRNTKKKEEREPGMRPGEASMAPPFGQGKISREEKLMEKEWGGSRMGKEGMAVGTREPFAVDCYQVVIMLVLDC